MVHHVITIHASIPQIRKLRKGHKVRVRHGKGVHVVVSPHTYNLCSRTFAKNKGLELALSPEEIEMNQSLGPDTHAELMETHGTGGGIFDSIYNFFRPHAKTALKGGLAAGATALGGFQPELIPFLAPGVAVGSQMIDDYFDKPSHHEKSGIHHGTHSGHSQHMQKMQDLASEQLKSRGNQMLNQYLGTNYDYMNTAGLQNAMAGASNGMFSNAETRARENIPVLNNGTHIPLTHGRYEVGGSLHHHPMRRKHLIERHTIGTNGGFVSYQPPALVSQPFSENFAMSHMLPPQYAPLNSSMTGHGMLYGNGLYAGSHHGHGLGLVAGGSGGGMGCGLGGGAIYMPPHAMDKLNELKEHVKHGMEMGVDKAKELYGKMHGHGFYLTEKEKELLGKTKRALLKGENYIHNKINGNGMRRRRHKKH